ncbi:MAG: YraN family protein [Candidatus Saganbacteria bacterium]|nr:YraN family protein [Candidatus Saganbacteria bacterium]
MGIESKILGNIGEDLACGLLIEMGWKVIERNFRSNHGEIDIIAKDEDILVFVEVKSYTYRSFYKPVFSITQYKKKSLIHAARTYIMLNGVKGINCRFDVIATYKDRKGEQKTEHFKNAFEIN